MWWWNKKKMKKHLPFTEGPYVPACTDVMTDFSKDGVFIRIYYPSDLQINIQEESDRWFPWIPHEKYVEGFGRVVNLWTLIIRLIMWLRGGLVYVPAIWEAKPHNKKMPVIIFSHGFGASRFLCSNIGTELASWGYFVAFVEHRDHSACATYYYTSKKDRDADRRTWIQHDTLKTGPEHYNIRNRQLHYRKNECINALDLLHSINEGHDDNVLLTKFKLSCFQGCLDFSSLIMMGHSFGAATSLVTLSTDSRFKLGIILDSWMFPMKNEEMPLVKQPLLFINTATFHIPSNLTALEALLNYPPEAAERTIFTIKHTTHENQTDTPFVFGYWLDLFMEKLSPLVAARISNNLMLKFINSHIVTSESQQRISACENFLSQHVDSLVEGTLLITKKAWRQFLPTVKA